MVYVVLGTPRGLVSGDQTPLATEVLGLVREKVLSQRIFDKVHLRRAN